MPDETVVDDEIVALDESSFNALQNYETASLIYYVRRRVVVLRRPLREGAADEKNSEKKAAKQLTLDLPEATHPGVFTSMPCW